MGSTIDVLGIYFFFLAQGILHENICKNNGFSFPIFMVAIYAVSSASLARLIQGWTHENSQFLAAIKGVLINSVRRNRIRDDKLEYHSQLLMASSLACCSYLVSIICTNYSMTKVPYPVLVVTKSAKAIPVIFGGRVIFGTIYPTIDYIVVFLITTGMVVYQIPKLLGTSLDQGSGIGYLALGVSLCCDALTGPRQDSIERNFKLSYADMMMAINLPAALITITSALFFEGSRLREYLQDCPHVLFFKLAAYAVCSAVGQVFIVRVLKSRGSLQLTMITSVRKLLSIIISVVLFAHRLTLIQWVGALTVLGAGVMKKFIPQPGKCKAA